MAIQRVGARPVALVHQAAATFALDGTQPSSNVPVHDANGNLVFPEETAADGSGLFEFEQRRAVVVHRVQINVPSADVAGWSLYITDGVLDVLVDSSVATQANYFSTAVPLILMRGESLKLVMVAASAGITRAKVIANEIDTSGEVR